MHSKFQWTKRVAVASALFVDERIFASIMGIRGVPTGFVLDRQGNMIAASEGPVDWDSPTALQYLTSL